MKMKSYSYNILNIATAHTFLALVRLLWKFEENCAKSKLNKFFFEFSIFAENSSLRNEGEKIPQVFRLSEQIHNSRNDSKVTPFVTFEKKLIILMVTVLQLYSIINGLYCILLYGKHHFRLNGRLWLAEKHFQRSIIFPWWTGGPLRKNKRMRFKTKQQN
jgi:hypothetical protein